MVLKNCLIFGRLGEVVCGLSPSRFDLLVPENDLQQFRSNWSSKCIVKKFETKAMKSKVSLKRFSNLVEIAVIINYEGNCKHNNSIFSDEFNLLSPQIFFCGFPKKRLVSCN